MLITSLDNERVKKYIKPPINNTSHLLEWLALSFTYVRKP